MHKVKHLFKWGAVFKVNNGLNCSFWHDCWLLNVPLRIAYEDLFKSARNVETVVAEHWVDGEWFIDFRRSLTMREYERWGMLREELSALTLSEGTPDQVTWVLEKKGFFSTKSLYKFLAYGGFPNRIAGHLWKCRIPLKIKFFLCQIFNNKLQCGHSLKKRGWKGEENCCLGDSRIETVNHIFFECVIAKLIWSLLKDVFHWPEVPYSIKSLSETWLMGKGPLPIKLLLFCFAGFAWAIWTNRNKMAIEHKFPGAPTDVIFVALSFMQKWSLLLKEEDCQRVQQVKETILEGLKHFKPSSSSPTDVYEI